MKTFMYPVALFAMIISNVTLAAEAVEKPSPTFGNRGITIITGSNTGAMVGVDEWNRKNEIELGIGASKDGVAWRVRRGGTLGTLGIDDRELDIAIKSEGAGRILQPMRIELGARKSSPDGRTVARVYLTTGLHGDRQTELIPWGSGIGAELRSAGSVNDILEIRGAIEQFFMGGSTSDSKDLKMSSGDLTRLKFSVLGKTPLKVGEKNVFLKGEVVYDGYNINAKKLSTGLPADESKSSVTGLFSTGVAW